MAILSHLRLRAFRNYEALDADFAPGLNVLVGANGQGKTNLLEAIYYLSLLRSFRTSQISSLRKWGAEAFYVGGRLLDMGAGAEETLSVGQGERRELRVGGGTVSKGSEFINRLVCVALVPEDMAVVKGPAGTRRRFLDITLSQISVAYMTALQRYVTALKCRNVMLRDASKYGQSAIRAYDRVLVRAGVTLSVARKEFVQGLDQTVAALGQKLLGSCALDVALRYSSALVRDAGENATDDELLAAYEQGLEKSLAKDMDEGRTRYGPHRDELQILLGRRVLSEFGSEGQCRLVSLLLYFGVIQLLHERGERSADVVLLVDDVLGELDSGRREAVAALMVRPAQTFLACTEVPPWARSGSTVFEVSGGKVELQTAASAGQG